MTYDELFAERLEARKRLKRKIRQEKPRRHTLVRQSLRERLMNAWVERRINERRTAKMEGI
jgi:hypothetical protein